MIRTDDNAPYHSKFQQAGLLAYGWWHAALSYCGRQLTDGFIADRDLCVIFPTATLEDVTAAVEALIREGSLHRLAAGQRSPCGRRRRGCPRICAPTNGVLLHDYFDYQERAQLARLRRRNLSTYGRQGGTKSGESRRASASSHAEASAVPLSVPIRSVPLETKPRRELDAVDNSTDAVDNSTGPPPETRTVAHATSPEPKQADRQAALDALARAHGLTTEQLRDGAAELARSTAHAMARPKP